MPRTPESGRRGGNPRNPRTEQMPPRPANPPAPTPRPSPEDPRRGEPMDPQVDPEFRRAPGGAPILDAGDVPPNPNPYDGGFTRTNGRTSYLSAGGERPMYDDSEYLDMGMEPYAEPVPAPRYQMPRYTPIQQTGGPGITAGTPERAAEQDRIRAAHAGNALEQDITDYSNYEMGRRGAYGEMADSTYFPMLNGGGYTPEEQQAILGQDRLNNLQLTPAEAESNYLSPDEQAAIMGNPEAGYEYFQPDRERTVAGQGAWAQRGAVNQMAGDFDAAVDENRLRMDPNYSDTMYNGVNATWDRTQEMLNDPDMEVSDQFLSEYQMSPEEQQRIVTSAGIDVRDRFGGAVNDMERRARAEGSNAMGVAAMRGRLERQAAGQAADAVTRARIGAESEAANRQRVGEDMRVGYGQRASGMRASNALNVGQMHQDAASNIERTRLGAEGNIAGLNSQNAAIAGTTRVNTERGIANQELDSERRFTDMGVQLGQQADANRTARAGVVATNRQGVNQGNQQERFNRGAYADSAVANRTAGVAGARRADQQEARGYVTGQQVQANQNVNAGMSNRLQNNATTQSATQVATGNQIAASGTPGKGERILGGVLGAASGVAGGWLGGREKGGVFTKPTYALIAESGPEAVVPIGAEEDDLEVLPSMALTAQPGSFNTAPQPMRGQSAYQMRYRRAM